MSLYPRHKILYRLKVVVRVRIGYALQTLVNHPVENGPASIGGVTHTGLRKRELREVAVHTNGYPDYTFDREASRRSDLLPRPPRYNKMSSDQQSIEYFSEVEVRESIATVRQMLKVGERVSDFIANLFETEQNGAIEWYEFLDFLLVIRSVPRPRTRSQVETAMREARKQGIRRPWSFDESGHCRMLGTFDPLGGGILSTALRSSLYAFSEAKKPLVVTEIFKDALSRVKQTRFSQ